MKLNPYLGFDGTCRGAVDTMTTRTLTHLLLALLLLASTGPAASAEVRELTTKIAGSTVHYKVVTPTGYDPAKTYPAVIVFGGGPQTMNTIDNEFRRNFQPEAERRGYLVFGVAAPDGQLFFDGGDRIFPELFRRLLAAYKVEGGKFHIAGPSNGGIASMHVAARFPEFARSATAFPGYLWEPNAAKLQRLKGICVFTYVGEHDEYRWHGEMKREVEFLRTLGTVANYSEEKGQPHRIATLADAGAHRLFDDFDLARKGCSTK